MDEFLYVGRKIYLFTRPDGTYLVERPKCCRRIFPETENINKAKTFMKIKTLDPSAQAWHDAKYGTCTEENEIHSDNESFENYQKTLDEIDEIIHMSTFDDE